MNLTIGIINHIKKHFPGKYFPVMFLFLVVLQGCHSNGGSQDDDEASQAKVKSKIDVTVASPRIGNISQYITLNATTLYQLNDAVRAPISGYIKSVNVMPGQVVKEGDVLFSMQSKEAAAMNVIKDTSLHISSIILVKATEAGIVKTIDRQPGDYVQDGDGLCTIANGASLVFMLDVPFEMHQYVKENGTYTITLPDGESIKTRITSKIPEMDKAVQMERYVSRASTPLNLPEGLIATVEIPTNSESGAVILPKSAILCNETQEQFWVMKLVHDSLAIKTPIEKGAETKDSVQVKTPVLSVNDKILISGNYGMPDTALVKVTH